MSVMGWIALFSCAAWVWLLLGQALFWRTDQRLPPGSAEPERWPSVAVVVPARDEAGVLPVSLPSLLGQDYPGRAEVVLVDDGSTDGTGDVARALARAADRARRPGGGGLPLTVVSPGPPEPGWTGKLWAVRHGVGAVRAREGGAPEFLLLTDADIAHAPDSLRRLVAAAEAHRLDLVSQMARLRVSGCWERLVVPAFVYFFCQLYPFRRINRGVGRTAAAAGGCVLLRAEAAGRAGVPEAIRDAVIDDVALARAVRRAGGRIWLGLAEHVDSVRPYPRLADLWGMVARSAYAQLRHSAALLALTVAGLALVYLAPPVCLAAGLAGAGGASSAGGGGAAAVAAWAGGAAWALMAGTYAPMLRYYRQPLWQAALLPLTAGLYLLMTVDSAVRHHRGRGAAWKGRTYPAPAPRAAADR
ncbi:MULTISPECIES: glycosyltransferase [Streptomyces]|uniref:N-glycosyltransferase n=2 Tax=Streptomyces fradiae ATCC 10745 = DSM 40063 TaxID=1319510 RepID=A0A1Y2NSR6_STRFR|nr:MULTISPECIES: glycosyltransferase [Streptomyces]OSY50516.1 N-glycosyltransferase [Streptomyces fradiae ATCC 10745 = DSM 40063]QEV10963.1 glycosyltransferase [Streptomyces fradiae ATCC 10745 = DSM 40063]